MLKHVFLLVSLLIIHMNDAYPISNFNNDNLLVNSNANDGVELRDVAFTQNDKFKPASDESVNVELDNELELNQNQNFYNRLLGSDSNLPIENGVNGDTQQNNSENSSMNRENQMGNSSNYDMEESVDENNIE